MIIASVSYSGFLKELPEETYAKLREIWPLTLPEDRGDYFYSLPECRLTLEEAGAIEALGIELTYKGVDRTALVKMKGDDGKWPNEDPRIASVIEGSAVQITIADFALLSITEVTWRDDCCTEEIQEMLDEGWRILAVCPPNAQRRPSYIMGRIKK